MYAMYPEWGPAHLRDEETPMSNGGSSQATAQLSVQTGLDLRDNGGQRPDDN